MQLRGSKALVTGGSRGLGYAIAGKLLSLGTQVVIAGRSADALERAAAALPTHPYTLVWDLAETAAIPGQFQRAREAMGGLDILVNNAGVLVEHHEWELDMLETTETEWDYVMDINLKAVFFLSQTAAKYMLDGGIRGNILNISSVAAFEPVYGPYGCSKAGVYGLTRGWAKSLAPHGIVVNGIAPGPVANDMNHFKPGDSMAHPRIPSGRFATNEEIAELAAFLLSREGENIAGHTVTSDGAYAVR